MLFPKISIVVPSYNQGQYLEETITSILNQEYPNLELFVVDGGSTDESVEIIKKYANRITWWVSENDKGQSDAINKGLNKATGDIISWINSDDVLEKGALASVADYFINNDNEIGLVHGGIILFRGMSEVQKDWGYSDSSIERYLAGMAFSQPSAFFKRSYFQKIGGLVSEDLHYGMDYDLYSRLALVSTFLPVKDIFARYRLHDESKSVSEQQKFIRDWSYVFINLCKNLKWTELVSELKIATSLSGELDYFMQFPFTPDQDKIKLIDKKKMMFYHLCYHIKASYLDKRFSDARKTLNWVKKNYDARLLSNEKSIPPIIRNLKFPDFIIRLMQNIKGKSA